jgi:aminoglycoside 2'-N-acetyltransferase I
MLQAPRIRRIATDGLTPSEIASIRQLLWSAFAGEDPMSEEDWEHAIAGEHFVAEVDGEIVGYASVAERELRISGQPCRAGYVEAVATVRAWQHRGIGTAIMLAVGRYMDETFELGALGTGVHA